MDAAGCGELMVVRVGGGWEMLVGDREWGEWVSG